MPIDPTLPFSRFGTAPRSPQDDRDWSFAQLAHVVGLPRASSLPDEVGLVNLENHPGVRNQADEGTCTGHGLRTVKVTSERRQRKTKRAKRNVPELSVRAAYEWGKAEGGYPDLEGAYLRDVVKAASKRGVAPEADWPYRPARPENPDYRRTIGTPATEIDRHARRWKLGAYYRVRTIDNILVALHTHGPVFMAMGLTETFANPNDDGTIPAPAGEDWGGHCMAFLAASQSRRRLLTANSWGVEWGDEGLCWIDFDHFMGADAEAWAIEPDARK